MNRFTKEEIEKVIQIVEEAGNSITFGMIRAYLDKTGWEIQHAGKISEWWSKGDNVARLPLYESIEDYNLRIMDAISDIAAEEKKSCIVIKLQIFLMCS